MSCQKCHKLLCTCWPFPKQRNVLTDPNFTCDASSPTEPAKGNWTRPASIEQAPDAEQCAELSQEVKDHCWKSYKLGNISADHTQRQVFEEVLQGLANWVIKNRVAEQGVGMAGEVQWEPAFDVMSWDQEKLAIKFCEEIAGKRGEKGSSPDPVRLLEMAQALYEAERKEFAPLPPTAIKEPDPLQELVDIAQEHDMGYGPNACKTFGKSRSATNESAGGLDSPWISVAERLPDTPKGNYDTVIVACHRTDMAKTYVFEACYLNQMELYSEDDDFLDCDGYCSGFAESIENAEYDEFFRRFDDRSVITHWMPMPAAPNDSEGEKG